MTAPATIALLVGPWPAAQGFIDLVGVPLFVVDVGDDGAFRFDGVNAAHEQTTGLTTAAVRGKGPDAILPIVEAAAVNARYRSCVEARAPITYDEELELPKGHTHWRTTLTPVIDERSGRIVKLLGSALEVSEQRETLERLERMNVELNQFVRAAAHDLRAPLRQMTGLLDLVQRRISDTAEPEGNKLIGLVQERCSHLVGLLEDLRAYAVAGGESTVARVDLPPLVAQAVQLSGAEPEVRFETALEISAVITMSAPLRQVLNNLVGNAVAHHDRPDGLVRVSCNWHRPGELEWVVSDDGPGIPAARRQWSLGPLNKGANSSGSGIGLAVVDKLVQQQGGRLELLDGLNGRGLSVRAIWPALPCATP